MLLRRTLKNKQNPTKIYIPLKSGFKATDPTPTKIKSSTPPCRNRSFKSHKLPFY
jgi:hypothetical protein